MKFSENLSRNRKEFESAVQLSLEKYSKVIENSYQAIGAYILIPGWFFSIPNKEEKTTAFNRNSAFIVYHWESFSIIENSFNLALAAQYSNALILLRVALETVIRGAFFQRLTQQNYRAEIEYINKKKDKRIYKLKEFIEKQLTISSDTKSELEEVSAHLYDIISLYVAKKKNQTSFRSVVRKLIEWKYFNPISNPLELIYDRSYHDLSQNVHILPDKTDIGRFFEKNSTSPYQLAIIDTYYLKQYLQ